MRVAPTPIIDNAKLLRAVGHLSRSADRMRSLAAGQQIDVDPDDAVELAVLSSGYVRRLLAEHRTVAS